jgi:hypothetical protein
MKINNSLPWLLIGTAAIAALCGIIVLVRHRRKSRRPLEEISNGCRTEYGPLELRIEATECSNEFRVIVEDHRLDRFSVHEEAVLSTLDSAKDLSIKKAGEYLATLRDSSRYRADWRCS